MYICNVRGRRQVDCGGVVGSPLLMRRWLTGERERESEGDMEVIQDRGREGGRERERE